MEVPSPKELNSFLAERLDLKDDEGRELATLDILFSQEKKEDAKGTHANQKKADADTDNSFDCPDNAHIHMKLKYEHPEYKVRDNSIVLDENTKGEWNLNEKWTEQLNNAAELNFFIASMAGKGGKLDDKNIGETMKALLNLSESLGIDLPGGKPSEGDDKDVHGLYI